MRTGYKHPSKRKVPAVVQGTGGEEYTVSKKKISRHEENKIQRPLVKVLEKIEAYTGMLTFFHVPNQLLRRSDLRKIFHGLGVRAGVPDLPIPISGGRTIWLELKYNGNKTSDKQDEFLDRLRKLGHIVEVIDAKDSLDAQNQLFEILARHGLNDFRYVHPNDRGDHVRTSE